jgi:hypothetical protein
MQCVGMSMIHLETKFHMPIFYNSFIIFIKPKPKITFNILWCTKKVNLAKVPCSSKIHYHTLFQHYELHNTIVTHTTRSCVCHVVTIHCKKLKYITMEKYPMALHLYQNFMKISLLVQKLKGGGSGQYY